MNTRCITLGFLLCLLISASAFAQGTRLLRHPTVSRDLVAFAYAGDLWLVSRSGGEARRLTSTSGVETDPYFSPDASQIAFTATIAGNTDVYVVPTAGGDPKRLTYHPGIDRVRGWTPDGRRVVLASGRTSAPQQAFFRLWTIGLEGGLPEPLSHSQGIQGCLLSRQSADSLRGVLDGLHSRLVRNQSVAALPGRSHAPDKNHDPVRSLRRKASVD